MPDPQDAPPGAPSPREALGQCHQCIARMLDRLDALAGVLAAGGGAPIVPANVRALVAELDEALAVHTADEETDVFPALLASADSPARRAQAFELVSFLLVEHRELAELWHALRVPLLALGGGVAVAFPGGTAADFLLRARGHLARETGELAELMGVLDPRRSREIGVSLAARHDAACPRFRDCPKKT